MPTPEEVLRAVATAATNTTHLETRDYEFSPSSQGQRSVIAEKQVRVPHGLREGVPFSISVPAYERLTADGDGNSSTYSLTHSLVDNPAVADDLVLYADGTPADPDSIDYDNDSFDYTDDGTAQDLDVFYLSGDQAELTLRISAPKNVWNEPISLDVGIHHRRDTNDDPVTFEATKNPLEGVAPEDYTLEWAIDAPYTVKRTVDEYGITATNFILSAPVEKAQEPINGLPALKRRMTK
jgi:hypothetical protein